MTPLREIRVGTRASVLALRQTEEIVAQLRNRWPSTAFVISTIATTADKTKNAPLIGMGLGVFVKELEQALLKEKLDLAVHSLKDIPSALPQGLTLAAVGRREDPRDALVDKWALPLHQLPPGARIGTSSPRRAAQLKALRPDIEVLPIRGNVDTRLRKARGGQYDGVVLAAAGLVRLGRQGEITQYLSPEAFTPAVGQGALAVETRSHDDTVLELVGQIDHWPTRAAVSAERSFLAAMGGGCKVPMAAYGLIEEGRLRLSGMVVTQDGQRLLRSKTEGDPLQPEEVGERLADALMRMGAAEVVLGGGAS